MAWTPFSAEAVRLCTLVNRLNNHGRISEMIEAAKAALEKAHRDGPSDMTYEEFEAELGREGGVGVK